MVSDMGSKLPDEWDNQQWDEALDDAYEAVDASRGKGSVTVT